MKSLILPFLSVLILLNCATGKISEKYEISGSWDWECCNGEYEGNMILMQDDKDNISGHMFDNINRSGGKLEGRLKGNILTFTRVWDKKKQQYNLQLGHDGRTLSGKLEGDHDAKIGVDFSAVRK